MRKWLVGAMVVGLVILCCAEAEAAKGWTTDFKKAVKAAQKTGRYMLLDFSGSDWCGWCVRLEKEVFSKKEFQEYAEKNLVCIMLDFPRMKRQSKVLKRQNQALLKKYGVRGFPTVLVLGPKGAVAGKTGYRRGGPEEYVKHLKQMIDEHKAKVKEAKEKEKPQ